MLETIIEKMASVFNIEKDKLSIDSDIKNTDNWTSLNHVALLIELCDLYNIQFKEDMVIELTSVKKILEFIEKKEGEKMEKVIEKISSMAIVVGIKGKQQKVLMLNNEGEWVFPKGHVEKNETELEAAIRELKEESGIEVKESDSLGKIDEFKFYFDGEKAVKVIKVFLFKVNNFGKININKEEGFIDGQWVDAKQSIDQLTHDDAREALKKGLSELGIINE